MSGKCRKPIEQYPNAQSPAKTKASAILAENSWKTETKLYTLCTSHTKTRASPKYPASHCRAREHLSPGRSPKSRPAPTSSESLDKNSMQRNIYIPDQHNPKEQSRFYKKALPVARPWKILATRGPETRKAVRLALFK